MPKEKNINQTTKKSSQCCCSTQPKVLLQPKENAGGMDAPDLLDSVGSMHNTPAPDLFSTGEETFNMEKNHKLTASARGLWNLHKEAVNASIEAGWDNVKHPWLRHVQPFWKFPTAFSTYAIPSLIIIEPQRFKEASECMRNSIQLMKDTPVWDEWVREGFSDNPITRANIMYKGHLILMYGLYQLVTGSTEFEQEYQQITKICLKEAEQNSKQNGYFGIECEPDQIFPQCNAMPMMAWNVWDKIYGTDLETQYSRKVLEFIREKITDPKTGLLFAKYHPSHDHAEAYLTGFCNSWALGVLHLYDKKNYERAYQDYKKLLIADTLNGQASYVKEFMHFNEPSTGWEESFGVLYSTALAKEYNDPELWERITRYFIHVYGLKLEGDTMRFTKVTPEDETLIHNYLFWGEVHLSWEKILNYDWQSLRKQYA